MNLIAQKIMAAAIEAAQLWPLNREQAYNRVHRADADGVFDNADESVAEAIQVFVENYL